MTNNDFVREAIREMATMVAFSKEKQEPKRGFWLTNYWLTPYTCYAIAKAIEAVNNEEYGEGNWKIDKDSIEKLMKGTDPA